MNEPRKRVNKYGKGARKTIVHDLFDIGTKQTSFYAPVPSSNVSSLVSSRERTPFSDVSDDHSVSRQLKSELLAQVNSNHSRLRSPARNLKATSSAPAAATFDLESSDEDTSKTKPISQTYKRRKLTPQASDNDEHNHRGRMVGPPSSARRSPARAKRKTEATVRTKPNSSEQAPEPSMEDMGLHSLKPKSRPISKPRPLSPPLRLTPEPRTPPDLGSPASDKSTSSMVSTRSATKRKLEAVDGAISDVSSPNQLKMSSLRLTPRGNAAPKSRPETRDETESSVTSPPRARRRLIDHLDSARPSSDEDVLMRDVVMTTTFQKKARIVQKQDAAQTKPTPSEQSTQQDDTAQHETIRPRKYGKQRSHLRDMMDEPEDYSQGSSQKSVDQLMSQVSAITDSQPAQFEFETISEDEADAGVQLKSIHELRQAGAVNRFDRVLETVLEDVSSKNKSVRIIGLMQLVRKLKEQAFKRHLLDHGKVSRLIDSIQTNLDIVSASIMLLAFWTLAHSDSATSQIILQLYRAILRLPAQLLTEERPLAVIAKDPQENLSKALGRDLADFESHVLDQSSGTGQKTSHIVTSRIALRSVETLQRRLAGGNEKLPSPPKSWLESATSSIKRHLKGLKNKHDKADAEHSETIRLMLAWLELVETSSASIGKKMSPLQLSDFGSLLGGVLTWAMNDNTTIEHSCLRLVIAMSNEGNSTSESLASVGLADSVFRLVEHKYPELAKQTSQNSSDDAEELASTTSTSVVLALGCLLDFADSSETIRLEMMDLADARGRRWTRVDKLVEFFKLFVQETDEAIDESQAPILVPFGYLSLLLCTLSLNDLIRQHITATIGRNFWEVVDRAAIFLERMRSVGLDEALATSFVDRFSLTLESVRMKREIFDPSRNMAQD